MSFGCDSGEASALKGLNGFNCQPSNSPKFNHQPSKKQFSFNLQTFKDLLDHLGPLPRTVLNVEVFCEW